MGEERAEGAVGVGILRGRHSKYSPGRRPRICETICEKLGNLPVYLRNCKKSLLHSDVQCKGRQKMVRAEVKERAVPCEGRASDFTLKFSVFLTSVTLGATSPLLPYLHSIKAIISLFFLQ